MLDLAHVSTWPVKAVCVPGFYYGHFSFLHLCFDLQSLSWEESPLASLHVGKVGGLLLGDWYLWGDVHDGFFSCVHDSMFTAVESDGTFAYVLNYIIVFHEGGASNKRMDQLGYYQGSVSNCPVISVKSGIYFSNGA